MKYTHTHIYIYIHIIYIYTYIYTNAYLYSVPHIHRRAPGTLTQAMVANLAPWSTGNWSTQIGGKRLPGDNVAAKKRTHLPSSKLT